MRAKMEQKVFMLPSEIGRPEIIRLTGASKAKIDYITKASRHGFPERTRLVNRCAVYDRTDVTEWLAKNDVSKIKILAYKTKERKPVSFDFNAMAKDFICRPMTYLNEN